MDNRFAWKIGTKESILQESIKKTVLKFLKFFLNLVITFIRFKKKPLQKRLLILVITQTKK